MFLGKLSGRQFSVGKCGCRWYAVQNAITLYVSHHLTNQVLMLTCILKFMHNYNIGSL